MGEIIIFGFVILAMLVINYMGIDTIKGESKTSNKLFIGLLLFLGNGLLLLVSYYAFGQLNNGI
jgi:hypothetical protein